MRLYLAAATLLALAGCTGDDGAVRSADSWAVATANPVAPPVSCIEQAEIRGTVVRDSRTIDFATQDGRLMRNRLPQTCAGLTGSRFIYRTSTDRLCSTDTITLVRPDGRAGASCGLGTFQEIVVPPQGAARR